MKAKLLALLLFVFTFLISAHSSFAMDSMGGMSSSGNMFMTAGFQITEKGTPLNGATVIMGQQSRVSDKDGRVEYEDVPLGKTILQVIYQGKEQSVEVNVTSTTTKVDLNGMWQNSSLGKPGYASEQAQASNLLITMVTILLCFGAAIVLIKKRHLLVSPKSKNKKKVRHGIIGAFLVLGLVSATTLGYQMVNIGKGATAFVGSTMAAEVTYTPDPAIPQPGNVKTYGDERMATVTWDPPANAEAQGIIGYVVRWGLNGVLTDSKQTIYDQIQIQPLQKDQVYTVTVQSVKGKKVASINSDGMDFKTGAIQSMVYNGDYVQVDPSAPTHTLSVPVQTTVKESSARVDAMRARDTGFFDDFNLPAGNLDETKWNTAYTGCADPGFNGTFINSQFHAHNQVQARSDYLDFSASGLPYCDRAAVSSRPRGIFDTSKATETNPAIIEVDVDGVPRHRDAWYIDFIPTNSRLNGVPVDLEGHDSIFQDDTNEPANVMRLVENNGGIMLVTWDANRKPSIAKIVPGTLNCPAWQGDRADLGSCNLANKVTKYSPFPENDKPLKPISNVRRHWVVEYARSTTGGQSTLSLSIDGIKVFSYYVPSNVDAFQKYQITTELFSYTTGKEHEFDYPNIMPTTTLFHWDNFGFSGPAATTVVHNYIDGGPDGMSPQYGTGTFGHPIERGNRTAKFNIPDQIGTPIKNGARVMFTMIELGNSDYTYPTGASVIVNGHTIPVPNPNSNVPYGAGQTGNLVPIASSYTPHSTGVYVDSSFLVTGMNTVQFNVGSDIINAHIELEYDKATAPAFTQPQNIFTNMNYGSFITPRNNYNDSYLFIEQIMGLSFAPGVPQPTSPVVPTTQPSATPLPSVIPSATPRPTAGPSATPFPTVTRAPTITLAPSVVPSPTSIAPTRIPTAGGTLGFTGIGGSIDSSDSNFVNSSRFTMGSSDKVVKSMSVYVGPVDAAPNNQFQVAIYSDNNVKPYQLVAKSASGTLKANSWNTIAITATLKAGKHYWLAYNTNGTNGSVNNMRFSSGGRDGYTTNSTAFGTWPTTFGSATIGTAKFSIYATFQ